MLIEKKNNRLQLEVHNQNQLVVLDLSVGYQSKRQVSELWNTYIERFFPLLNEEFHRHDH